MTTLAHTMPGHRFWSSQSLSLCSVWWRMENASVLHLLGGMYESRAQLQQHNILFAKFLKLLWKSSHREKLAAGAAPVVLFKFEHFLGTSLPLHIAGYFFPRKMSGKFSHLLLIVSSTKSTKNTTNISWHIMHLNTTSMHSLFRS